MMTQRTIFFHAFSFILLVLSLLIVGCGHANRQQWTSLADYLYPIDPNRRETTEMSPQPTPTSLASVPVPFRLGLAFLPDRKSKTKGNTTFAKVPYDVDPLSEEVKVTLMQQVREDLGKYSFISSIDVIPSSYLLPRGSYRNLVQLGALTGVDVIALISYDQVQFTDEGVAALGYVITLGSGFWFWPGEKNDTKTMIDAAAYYIRGQRLLFKAVGQSRVEGYATPLNLTEALRDDSEQGFRDAVHTLVINLHAQIQVFKKKMQRAQTAP